MWQRTEEEYTDFCWEKPIEGDHFEDLELNGMVIRERSYTCNVALWRVRVTIVAVEKQQCIIS